MFYIEILLLVSKLDWHEILSGKPGTYFSLKESVRQC